MKEQTIENETKKSVLEQQIHTLPIDTQHILTNISAYYEKLRENKRLNETNHMQIEKIMTLKNQFIEQYLKLNLENQQRRKQEFHDSLLSIVKKLENLIDEQESIYLKEFEKTKEVINQYEIY